jgi:hypothetical protein
VRESAGVGRGVCESKVRGCRIPERMKGEGEYESGSVVCRLGRKNKGKGEDSERWEEVSVSR